MDQQIIEYAKGLGYELPNFDDSNTLKRLQGNLLVWNEKLNKKVQLKKIISKSGNDVWIQKLSDFNNNLRAMKQHPQIIDVYTKKANNFKIYLTKHPYLVSTMSADKY